MSYNGFVKAVKEHENNRLESIKKQNEINKKKDPYTIFYEGYIKEKKNEILKLTNNKKKINGKLLMSKNEKERQKSEINKQLQKLKNNVTIIKNIISKGEPKKNENLTIKEKGNLNKIKMNERKEKKNTIKKRIMLLEFLYNNNKVIKINKYNGINERGLLNTISNNEINNLKLNTKNNIIKIDEFLKKKANKFIQNNPKNWKKSLSASESTGKSVRNFGSLTNKERENLTKGISVNANTLDVYLK
jgi:hypothetical protein